MPLIDTHAHLDEQSFENDFAEVLQRAAEAGLERIISVGTTVESSRTVIALSEQYPNVSAIVGIHPNYSSQAHPGDFEIIEELAKHPRVVAVGETGLDKYWDFAPIDIQREFFVRHIKLSQECRKPFVVHCRDAEPETLEVLREMAEQGSLNGVMHSFCGSANTRDACLELGMNFSVGGMVTYKKNVELREIISGIPLDRLMLETDCPYLSPIPVRGQRNEPAYVAHTAKCLGDVFGLSPVEIGNITTENARRVFSLSE